MNVKLFCPNCKKETIHAIRPWATENNYFGAVSIMCELGCKLLIAELKNLPEIKLPKMADE